MDSQDGYNYHFVYLKLYALIRSQPAGQIRCRLRILILIRK